MAAANNQEIEERYLLAGKPDIGDIKPSQIMQGYLFRSFERTVRYRIEIMPDESVNAFETIKGPKTGNAGSEVETAYPLLDAVQKLLECGSENIILKDRYRVPTENGLVWEIDGFKRRLSGLWIAEIELPAQDTQYLKPAWLKGVNITEDRSFANAKLVDVDEAELKEMVRKVLEPAGLKSNL